MLQVQIRQNCSYGSILKRENGDSALEGSRRRHAPICPALRSITNGRFSAALVEAYRASLFAETASESQKADFAAHAMAYATKSVRNLRGGLKRTLPY